MATVDRNKVKAQPEYQEVLDLGYKDTSGKIQVQKGAFRFEPTGGASKWQPAINELRYYNITSTGTVRATKGAGNKTLGKIQFDLAGYKQGLELVASDIEKFKAKIERRKDLKAGKDAVVAEFLAKPVSVKQRVYRKYLMIRSFREAYDMEWWKGQMFRDIYKLKNKKELDNELHSMIRSDYKTFKRLSK